MRTVLVGTNNRRFPLISRNCNQVSCQRRKWARERRRWSRRARRKRLNLEQSNMSSNSSKIQALSASRLGERRLLPLRHLFLFLLLLPAAASRSAEPQLAVQWAPEPANQAPQMVHVERSSHDHSTRVRSASAKRSAVSPWQLTFEEGQQVQRLFFQQQSQQETNKSPVGPVRRRAPPIERSRFQQEQQLSLGNKIGASTSLSNVTGEYYLR